MWWLIEHDQLQVISVWIRFDQAYIHSNMSSFLQNSQLQHGKQLQPWDGFGLYCDMVSPLEYVCEEESRSPSWVAFKARFSLGVRRLLFEGVFPVGVLARLFFPGFFLGVAAFPVAAGLSSGSERSAFNSASSWSKSASLLAASLGSLAPWSSSLSPLSFLLLLPRPRPFPLPRPRPLEACGASEGASPSAGEKELAASRSFFWTCWSKVKPEIIGWRF